MKKLLSLFVIIIMITTVLSGCGSNDDTIQTCIISNTGFTSQSKLEAAEQTQTLKAGESVYASVHFIESPKGMEYTAKWYLDGSEIKSETKETVNDTHDIVVYELEAEKSVAGTLKLEVIYNDTVLRTQELKIQ